MVSPRCLNGAAAVRPRKTRGQHNPPPFDTSFNGAGLVARKC